MKESKKDNLAYKMAVRINKYFYKNDIVKRSMDLLSDTDLDNVLSNMFDIAGEKDDSKKYTKYDTECFAIDEDLDWGHINDYIQFVPFIYTKAQAKIIKTLLNAVDDGDHHNHPWRDSNFIMAAEMLYALKIKE